MFDKVKSDLLASMKEQDKFKLGVLRMLKKCSSNGTNKYYSWFNWRRALTVIRREVKRNSSIQEYEKFGKTDTVQDLKAWSCNTWILFACHVKRWRGRKNYKWSYEKLLKIQITKSMGKIISLVKKKQMVMPIWVKYQRLLKKAFISLLF